MNSRALLFAACLIALTLSLGALALCAQDEPQPALEGPPKAAGISIPGWVQPEGELEPDFSSLTGMQTPTVGRREIRRSYWVPGLQFSSNVSSNPYNQSGGSGWVADNYMIGNLSLLEAWRPATLAVNYSSGGFVSTGSQGSGWYQQLALAQTYQTKRWLFQLVDQFSYIPESSLGFGGGTNLGIPGVGGSLGTIIPGLGGNYVPNQSIYGVGPYYNNVAALQANYALSHRSSVTVAGSYGLLSFTESSNSDSRTTVASIGYNYELSRSDTLGLVYRFSSYQFPGNPQAYGDNVFSLAFGRKITGRLALRLFVGPEVTTYRVPVGSDTLKTGVSASASLTFAFRQGATSLAYVHGLSAGSGVFIGSDLDQVIASASRNLTRVWTGGLNFGYARNRPVDTSTSSHPGYDDWFAGVSLGRPIGRDFRFAAAYTATIGNYFKPGCGGAACNNSNVYSTITVTFQWHPSPFILP